LTRIAMERVSLYAQMEFGLRFWNSNGRLEVDMKGGGQNRLHLKKVEIEP